MKRPEVSPTTDYLKALTVAGVKIVDLFATSVDADLNLVRVLDHEQVEEQRIALQIHNRAQAPGSGALARSRVSLGGVVLASV